MSHEGHEGNKQQPSFVYPSCPSW